jgi:hypothetical protein
VTVGQRTTRRVERIRAEIPITRLLAGYGYQVQDVDREQQFPCDLHGDGTDGKPSARVYPANNQWYCFGCARSRDAIQTVREKEGLDFPQALDKLEKDFGLPPLPWEEGDQEAKPRDVVADILDAPYVDPVRNRCERFLRAIMTERTEPLPRVLKMWEAFDRARVLEDRGEHEPMKHLLATLLRPRT